MKHGLQPVNRSGLNGSLSHHKETFKLKDTVLLEPEENTLYALNDLCSAKVMDNFMFSTSSISQRIDTDHHTALKHLLVLYITGHVDCIASIQKKHRFWVWNMTQKGIDYCRCDKDGN